MTTLVSILLGIVKFVALIVLACLLLVGPFFAAMAIDRRWSHRIAMKPPNLFAITYVGTALLVWVLFAYILPSELAADVVEMLSGD